ncbi:MAG: DUF6318 family protein [Actinomycetota bacterium]|nr:DUF6318 family protein [Actinomycetota bacterium]
MTFRCVCLGGLVLALLAGCSQDDPPASTLPPLSVAPSPSAPSAEPVPTAAQAATPQGAAEFARFWFTTLNEAARTGDTQPLERISAPDCPACIRFVESIGGLYASGGRIEGGVFVVREAEAPALDPSVATARVTVIYDVSPSRQIDANGMVLRSVEALTGIDGDMRLVRQEGVWRVSSLTV